MMHDKQLLSLLKDEEADAVSFYSSEIAHKQTEALERYNVEPYGDEVTGRSRVLTQDVADAMDWTLASFRKVFMNSTDLVALEATAPEQDDHLDDGAAYLSHTFFKDNDGKTIIRTFAFDGLLMKIGIASASWQDGEKMPPQEIEGALPAQLDRYVTDPEYEILGQEERIVEIEGQETRVFDMEVQRTPRGKVIYRNIAAENFLVSRRAATLPGAEYRGHHSEEYLVDLKRQFPDAAKALDPLGSVLGSNDDIDREADPRREERFTDEPENTFTQDNREERREKVTMHNEYIRVDYDEDGTTELMHVKRVGNVILEKMRVEDCEYAVWCPIPVGHRLIGKSLADRVIEVQKVNTVMTRATLDNVQMSVRPRNVVNVQAVPEEWHDVILDHQIGGIIPAQGDTRAAITPLVVPDMTDAAGKVLERYEVLAEKQTGITRHSQGLDPETLTQTKGGIAMHQSAGNERKEDYADLLAAGLEMLLTKGLKLLCHHQDHARVVKVGKQWVEFDPREWSDEMTVTVHVGRGVGSRESQLAHLNIIAAKQEQILATLGANNPLVTMNEYRNTLARIVEVGGYREPSQFFKDLPEPDPNAEPPAEQPTPDVIEAQANAQKMLQESQAEIDRKMFEVQEKARLDEMKLQGDLANDAKRIDRELDMEERQKAAELDLAERVKMEELAIRERTGQAANVPDVQVGGDPG